MSHRQMPDKGKDIQDKEGMKPKQSKPGNDQEHNKKPGFQKDEREERNERNEGGKKSH